MQFPSYLNWNVRSYNWGPVNSMNLCRTKGRDSDLQRDNVSYYPAEQ